MKKKSGHRRRTKMVRRSRKNLRRTNKRKRLGKGRRRPTRRYSRIQRGGMTEEELNELIKRAIGSPGKAGSPDDQFKLGVMYYDGDGVEQNMQEAFKWFKLAASWKLLNFPEALYYVGFMYANGLGVNQNYEKALEWYKRAAAMGDSDSMYEVSSMYYRGQGVKQNTEKALNWYSRAKKALLQYKENDLHYLDNSQSESNKKNESHLSELDKLRELDKLQKDFYGDKYESVIPKSPQPP